MGLFANQKALDGLQDRLGALELKCEGLERAKKSIDMEFTELYDKVSHQMSRMAKRYSRAEKPNGEDLIQPKDNETSSDTDPVSAAILARRNRGYLAQ